MTDMSQARAWNERAERQAHVAGGWGRIGSVILGVLVAFLPWVLASWLGFSSATFDAAGSDRMAVFGIETAVATAISVLLIRHGVYGDPRKRALEQISSPDDFTSLLVQARDRSKELRQAVESRTQAEKKKAAKAAREAQDRADKVASESDAELTKLRDNEAWFESWLRELS